MDGRYQAKSWPIYRRLLDYPSAQVLLKCPLAKDAANSTCSSSPQLWTHTDKSDGYWWVVFRQVGNFHHSRSRRILYLPAWSWIPLYLCFENNTCHLALTVHWVWSRSVASQGHNKRLLRITYFLQLLLAWASLRFCCFTLVLCHPQTFVCEIEPQLQVYLDWSHWQVINGYKSAMIHPFQKERS